MIAALTSTNQPPPPSGTSYLGRHILAEFYDCNSNVLNNPTMIEQLMKEAALACGATIVESCFHLFNPFGVSGVVVIAESHLAIHTWPEHGYAAVDFFTCGDSCDPAVSYEYMRKALGAGHSFCSELTRGFLNPETRQMVHASFKVQENIETPELCVVPHSDELGG
jgi:S-adenosylmethionine decarboxylase proenzyme